MARKRNNGNGQRAAGSGPGANQGQNQNKAPQLTNAASAPASSKVAQLELPEGFVLKNKVDSRNRNRTKKPKDQPTQPNQLNQTRMAGAAPRIVIPKPWEIDAKYTGTDKPVGPPGDPKLRYNYNRQWPSFNVGHDKVGDELAKELSRQRRAALPRLYTNWSEERLQPLKEKYKAANELELYKRRLAARDAPPNTRLIFASPLASGNQAADSFSPANDANPLIHFLTMPELATRLLKLLTPSIRDLASLAAVCRSASVVTAHNMELWDVETGSFLTDDDRFQPRTGHDGNVVESKGVRANILVIAPMGISETDNKTPYLAGWRIMEKLVRGFVHIRNSFRDIIIDQLPCFDIRLFEMMVQTMPNLESVGISRCLLLDVSKLKPLLEIVKRHPRRLPNGRTRYVRLDFAPYFFEGPSHSNRLGSFGVTHHEPTFHIPRAVFGSILQCERLAREVGMDLLSEGSSFWRFVCRVPGNDDLWAIKARDAVITRDRDLARARKGESAGRAQRVDAALQTFADNVTAAVAGDNVEPLAPPYQFQVLHPADHRSYGYWRREKRCERCSHIQLHAFYNYHVKICYPCKMQMFVDTMDTSHFRYRIQCALDYWIGDLDVSSSTLKALLEGEGRDVALVKAVSAVNDTDNAFNYHLRFPTGPANELAVYPELPNASREGASLRRWALYMGGGFSPTDFRQGGPQQMHPAYFQMSENNVNHEKYGTESPNHFRQRWQWSPRTEEILAEALLKKHINDPNKPTPWDYQLSPETLGEYLAMVRRSDKELRYAMKLEYRGQNQWDFKVHQHHYCRIEVMVFSYIGPREHSYNLDKLIVQERIDNKYWYHRKYHDGRQI
ncbi:hypothetical protein B0T25DRAFT_522778 [Lasiosphaeria hispida]|uniref:Uncharacterized protein n=1 Tax=Lasiosphaeria hispida TaxID=260671 RepID=A0AAJ0M8J4_9PEZI|nr:hypothetical protein B0T25DRAFT_522778 [Lasiosphaeria hispida]